MSVADADLALQLRNATTQLRNATSRDLSEIVDRGANWDLDRLQNVFRALEQFVWLAGGPQLPRHPGGASVEQRQAFTVFVADIEAGGLLPADRPRADEKLDQSFFDLVSR